MTTQSELNKIVARRNAKLQPKVRRVVGGRRLTSRTKVFLDYVPPQPVIDMVTRALAIGKSDK